MNERTSRGAIPPSRIWRRAGPDPEGVAEAARLVLGAERPVLFAGDRVAQSGATEELVALAERIGADIHGDVLPAQVNVPAGHPCVRAQGFGDHAQVRAAVGDADLVLLVGGEFFEEVWYVEDAPFPEGAPVIQIDSSARNLGRNHRLDCGLFADPKLALGALLAALEEGADDPYRAGAAARMERIRARKEAEDEAIGSAPSGPRPGTGRCPPRAMHERGPRPTGWRSPARRSPRAGTSSAASSSRPPGTQSAPEGGGIGQGLPTGIGLKLARPERPVLCVSGDGSALYTIQALWTAAHHRIPVVFVILNNRVYPILKYNMNRFRAIAEVEGRAGSYRHLDLTDPDIDYVSVAQGFGVEARRVTAPEDDRSRRRGSLRDRRPVPPRPRHRRHRLSRLARPGLGKPRELSFAPIGLCIPQRDSATANPAARPHVSSQPARMSTKTGWMRYPAPWWGLDFPCRTARL